MFSLVRFRGMIMRVLGLIFLLLSNSLLMLSVSEEHFVKVNAVIYIVVPA